MPLLFPFGHVVATPSALEALERNSQNALQFLMRHQSGDWGDLDQSDKDENDRSLKHGDRILSAYHLNDQTKIWIISEADQSSTCVLLPEDY
jgi:hypothetical protein